MRYVARLYVHRLEDGSSEYLTAIGVNAKAMSDELRRHAHAVCGQSGVTQVDIVLHETSDCSDLPFVLMNNKPLVTITVRPGDKSPYAKKRKGDDYAHRKNQDE